MVLICLRVGNMFEEGKKIYYGITNNRASVTISQNTPKNVDHDIVSTAVPPKKSGNMEETV